MTTNIATPNDYPVTLDLQAATEIARWRPLAQWILAIPHFIVLSVLEIVVSIMAFVAWIVGVFTGRIPEGIQGFIALYVRYSARTSAYAAFMHETYPPFSFDMAMADPGDHPPITVNITPEIEGRNRLTIFFRLLLIIPAAIVLGLVSVVAYIAIFIAFFAVLVTGHWPAGLYKFAVGFLRWTTRVNAYGYLLTDKYPPFSLD